MTNLLIDTCVWLDIAKSTKGEGILHLIEQLISENKIELIIPEIVLTEFDRNKDRTIASAKKSVSEHLKKVRELVFSYSDKDNRQNILNELNNLDHLIPIKSDIVTYSITRIETLFKQSLIIRIDNDIKIKATDRAINKLAPFHLSKNSIGDALIIESYAKFQRENKKEKIAFVTHNKNDFSLQNGNQKLPHEDLMDIFKNSNSNYYINLLDCLNDIEPDFIEELGVFENWETDPRGITEISDKIKEFDKKIWYNRHKILETKIENGEVQIIDYTDFHSQSIQNSIVKEIWETAKQNAKIVEENYGKENLDFDDFEWGMINGKLSALRWILGEEWDNLDT
ncbi:PIN domain-containing protein [Gillisia sp. CAL575]|uniref:PIN domain-containing protein n=1 Tax=Gillisia sp. CAL575 TaxID=985255 RepID=UPI0003A72E01|nr:PIN domain-containing protein [Gillisia sp. CAL575]